MKSQVAYTLLLSSFPPHPLSLWNTKYKPVSRLHLEKSLCLLTDSDAKLLAAIEQVLMWSKAVDNHTIDSADKLLNQVQSPLVKAAIQWRLELRTIIAALRHRQLERNKPDALERWGYSRIMPLILSNWSLNDFGLSARFPWIKTVMHLFEQHEPFELEKVLLNLSWQYYSQLGQAHYFDFDAVVIYVLRWDIASRWVKYDASLAQIRFNQLVDEGLGDLVTDSTH